MVNFVGWKLNDVKLPHRIKFYYQIEFFNR